MAGSKLPRWQRVSYEKFQDLLKTTDFVKDLEYLAARYSHNSTELYPWLLWMLKRYDAPRGVFILMRQYIYFDKQIDPTEIPAPMAIISERDQYVGPTTRCH